MDDLFDFLLDLFLELFTWERMNEDLRKKIPNRPIRWAVTTLIYLVIITGLIAFLAFIFWIISKLV